MPIPEPSATSLIKRPSAAASVPIEMTEVVGVEGRLSGLDKQLLRLASAKNGRISAEELSDGLNNAISPARAISRLREILGSHDMLDMGMRKMLLLEDMVELKEHLFDIVRKEGGIVETKEDGEEVYSFGDPRWSANLIRLFKELNRLIEADQKAVDESKVHLRNAHANLFYQALELAFSRLIFNIKKQYPKVDESLLRQYVEEALPAAFGLIEQRTEAP